MGTVKVGQLIRPNALWPVAAGISVVVTATIVTASVAGLRIAGSFRAMIRGNSVK